MRLLESNAFPFEFLSKLAERESWRKEIHRPIYHVHKWWAKRLGSVFRGILIGTVLPEGRDLAKEYLPSTPEDQTAYRECSARLREESARGRIRSRQSCKVCFASVDASSVDSPADTARFALHGDAELELDEPSRPPFRPSDQLLLFE